MKLFIYQKIGLQKLNFMKCHIKFIDILSDINFLFCVKNFFKEISSEFDLDIGLYYLSTQQTSFSLL
jgi:hypothetical protein